MLGGRGLALMVLAASLAGCGGKVPGVYDLPIAEAFNRLATNKLDEFKFRRQCGILVHIEPEAVTNESVTWNVYSEHEHQVSFTARLTALGDKQTKVDVEMSKDKDGTEAYAGNDFYPHPAFHQPLRPAVEEAIAAILESRPFDLSKVPKGGDTDSVCSIQRSGLEESGRPFSIHDRAGEHGGR